MDDPTKRFSNRVTEYVKYRPGYPPELLETLAKECGLQATWRIADLGCGPGNLARLFLKNGNAVYGVEPNKEMREAAEHAFDQNRWFRSVDGRAEATTLASESVEMVIAGQAFHWFDVFQTKLECKRILTAGGWAALVWNERRRDASRFMERYERTLEELVPEYRASRIRGHGEENIERFFGPGTPMVRTYQHHREMGWEAFSGLVLSASYVPKMGQPGHHPLMEALRMIFEADQHDGKIRISYQTMLNFGRLK